MFVHLYNASGYMPRLGRELPGRPAAILRRLEHLRVVLCGYLQQLGRLHVVVPDVPVIVPRVAPGLDLGDRVHCRPHVLRGHV